MEASEGIECSECASVMGILSKTPRWKLYKCFTCRHVMGKIDPELKEPEFRDAVREMDSYARAEMRDQQREMIEQMQRMTPQELEKFFGGR